jgi:hypothetical protein
MSLPLEGLLVADFSHVLAGPLAAASPSSMYSRRRMRSSASWRRCEPESPMEPGNG